jgi:putative membrane protein insertion efficiency factor
LQKDKALIFPTTSLFHHWKISLFESQHISRIESLSVWVFSLLIRCYQIVLSPLLGSVCRFSPSCSTYAIEALKKHGLMKGLFLAIKRLLRCHPWNEGGVDPVP